MIQNFDAETSNTSLPEEVMEEVARLIRQAEQAYNKKLAEHPNRPKIRNSPLSRLLTPPKPISDEEPGSFTDWIIELTASSKGVLTGIRAGDTDFHTSKAAWAAYPDVRELLSNILPPHELRERLYQLFHVRYGAMVVCRSTREDGARVILMGRRAWNGSLNEGKASFPAGFVDAGEKIIRTAYRELHEETGFEAQCISPPGSFARYEFPEVPSVTFAMLLETSRPQKARWCDEVDGGLFVWIPERALRSALDGTNEQLVHEFRSQKIMVPDNLEIASDAAAVYRVLVTFFPR